MGGVGWKEEQKKEVEDLKLDVEEADLVTSPDKPYLPQP